MDAYALHGDYQEDAGTPIKAEDTVSQETTPSMMQKALQFVFDHIQVTAALQNKVIAAIHDTIKTRLKEDLNVPVAAQVAVDTTVHTRVAVPLRMELSATELGISDLEIAVDQQILVEDTLELDTEALVDGLIDLNPKVKDLFKKTLPLSSKTRIKLNQPIRIHGTIRPKVKPFSVQIQKNIEIDLAVPIKQTIDVKGQATVRVDQDVTVPLIAKIPVEVNAPLTIKVQGVSVKSANRPE